MVLLPRSEEEISQCVKACRDVGVDFVISGGRHNPSGASSIENGAVIDLRLMNKITVDKEAMTITAEGGCLWADLDEEAAKYDLCAVGGKFLKSLMLHFSLLLKLSKAQSTILVLLDSRLVEASDG